MSVHPIEYRYGRSEVKKIFDEESKLQAMLDVESALVKALAKAGIAPKEDAEKVSEKATTRLVTVERVQEIEDEIHHDMMAVVKALSEQCGEASTYIHYGATSNDILDTSLALQLKKYVKFLEDDLLELKKVLLGLAKEKKRLVCVGRTHGQHAIPLTYGLKFAMWACEVQRHIERLAQAKERILVGQMTGAVGTQAAFADKGIEIQDEVMKTLGLAPVKISNQIIQRDRHAEFLQLLALISESLNKFATEVRNLQRTEIMEVSEGFGKKQVGSSTMPHKRNPIIAEQVCGLARVVKANACAELENIPLWHERDLTNSSPERILIPEACILTDHMLVKSISLFKNLVFHEENIKRNLGMSGGRIMAESVMIRLAQKGVPRQEAHELVRELSMKSHHEDKPLMDLLKDSGEITAHLDEKEIDDAMNPEKYLGTALKQVDRVLKELS
ncbi:MAG TPA: adenylosuccinate lyase [Candidatus Altiarchaeales archaeon]|nr:adenylosuccinate lyase [Candidatus Altiarchaeales archaeon]